MGMTEVGGERSVRLPVGKLRKRASDTRPDLISNSLCEKVVRRYTALLVAESGAPSTRHYSPESATRPKYIRGCALHVVPTKSRNR